MKKAASMAEKQGNAGLLGAKKKKRKLSLLQAPSGGGPNPTENSVGAENVTTPEGTSPAKIAKKEGSTEEQKPVTATVLPG